MKALIILSLSTMALSGASFYEKPAEQVNSTVVTVNQQEMFSYFRAHRQGSGVALSWGTTTLSNVVGFIIERSYDGDFFENIQQVMPTNARNTWRDTGVFPGYIHYRIGCVMSDGTTHYSQVETVRIVQHG